MRKDAREQPERVGGNVRMGLEIDAMREIEGLKSEIGAKNSAGGELSNGGDSIRTEGIPLQFRCLILPRFWTSTKSGWNRAENRASKRTCAE